MKTRKILKIVFFVLLPLLLVAAVLMYLKLYNFRSALEELVTSQTNGQYILRIEKSSIDFSTLRFSFRGVTIDRNPEAPKKGIRTVHVPSFDLQFGSATAMLRVRQFDIKSLVIEEPVVEVDATGRANKKPRAGINVSHQILSLYPAIESLLGRFNIESLAIRRASLKLERPLSNSMKVGLIDLLMEHWDIDSLTDRSQLQLKIAGQDLHFGKAVLNFSGMEFNFKNHFLRFNDFKLSTVDTVTNSNVDISGKSISLHHLDYKALHQHQRYILRRTEINEPVITARFNVKNTDLHKTKKKSDQDALTRILTHTFGDCAIDTTIIRDARIHMVLHKDHDSVKVDLPKVDFRFLGFSADGDSTMFQLRDIEMDIDRAAISLHKNVGLSFDRILFEKGRNVTVTNLSVFDSVKMKKIASVGTLRMDYFRILYFVFRKEFLASSIFIEDADIHLAGAPKKGGRTKGAPGIARVDVGKIDLKNTSVYYNDTGKTISINGLSVLADHIHYDTSAIDYIIRRISVRNGFVNERVQRVEAHVKGLQYDGHIFKAAELALHKDSLTLTTTDILADAAGDKNIKNYQHWNHVSVGSIRASGRMPQPNPATHTLHRKEGPLDLSIGELTIRRVEAAVQGRGKAIAFAGQNLRMDAITFSREAGFKFRSAIGDLSNVAFDTPSMHAAAASLHIRYPETITLNDVALNANGTDVALKGLDVRAFEQRAHQWYVGSIRARALTVSKDDLPLLVSDSVHISGSLVGGKTAPAIARVEVFHPTVSNLGKKSNAPAKPDHPAKQGKLPIPDQLVIHPGEVKLAGDKAIAFGTLCLDQKKNTLTLSYVETGLDKMNIRIRNIAMANNQLSIDTVQLLKNKEWFRLHQIEDSELDAALYHLVVKGVSVDSLVKHKTLRNVDVIVDNFSMDIRRDKRLPDPPVTNKPHTLHSMLKFPSAVKLNTVTVKDGNIRYTQISDKTGEAGSITLDDISVSAKFAPATSLVTLDAKTKLFSNGQVNLRYQGLDTGKFVLDVKTTDFDLTKLNQIVVPLQSLKIKSGYLKEYTLSVTADREQAVGEAEITYDDLHLEIYKRGEPDKKNLAADLLTLLADGIILKHSKEKAYADVHHSRVKHKSIFNYWVGSSIHGAMGAVRKGKAKKAPRA